MLIEPKERSIIIQTRQGNDIANEPGLKITPVEAWQRQQFQRGEYPAGQQLSVRKEPTGAYNCHGMTFLSRRAFLIDEDAVELILRDDAYYDVELSWVHAGDIVLYYFPNGELSHSGIVVYVPQDEGIRTPWILSKWGHGGEYLHRYTYCPYYPGPIRWMREGQHDCTDNAGN